MIREIVVAVSIFVIAVGPMRAARGAEKTTRVLVTVDFGDDDGANYGSLYEARDQNGEPVAGAGFLGAYNTQARSDRRLLHFYLNANEPQPFEFERLPRANDDAGTYLFGYGGDVFSFGRGGRDQRVRRFDRDDNTWEVDESTPPLAIAVADGRLSNSSREIRFDDQPVLQIAQGDGQLGAVYYAGGHVVYRQYNSESTPATNVLRARKWSPGDAEARPLRSIDSIELRTPGEFVYAYGQLRGDVVAATNTGGIYVFEGDGWKCVLEPDMKTSYQVYAMLNYHDELLLGQYPTGEIFVYDGETVTRREGWPPVMPGVSGSAREAQTLTIFGGELHAGVWPWAEVWRLNEADKAWRFQARMFSHPEPTDETTHPYENESKAAGIVLNQWGQRVTSMVPLGDALYISTSAKGDAPFESTQAFLNDAERSEYGAIYRRRQPGVLAVPFTWTEGSTRFEFRFSGDEAEVFQDGRSLGLTRVTNSKTAQLADAQIRFGRGVFGEFAGTITDAVITDDAKRATDSSR